MANHHPGPVDGNQVLRNIPRRHRGRFLLLRLEVLHVEHAIDVSLAFLELQR